MPPSADRCLAHADLVRQSARGAALIGEQLEQLLGFLQPVEAIEHEATLPRRQSIVLPVERR
jgi:hypothetical protein